MRILSLAGQILGSVLVLAGLLIQACGLEQIGSRVEAIGNRFEPDIMP